MKILSVRDFCFYSGGHLKYLDYLHHMLRFEGLELKLYLTPRSKTDSTNPFLSAGLTIVAEPEPADGYFIAGLDWAVLDAAGIDRRGEPVINLIQGLSHAHPDDPKYAFLSRPALRICVSEEVAEAIRATGRVNGEIVTIPNGVDLDALGAVPRSPERAGVFISGGKAPQLARALQERLAPVAPVDLADAFVPRDAFLERLSRAQVAVLLPLAEEGFYLPALEAMALGALAIVPDCIGNRGFCAHGRNCLMPAYDLEAILQATLGVYGHGQALAALAAAGRETAARHSLTRERELFLSALSTYLRSSRSLSEAATRTTSES